MKTTLIIDLHTLDEPEFIFLDIIEPADQKAAVSEKIWFYKRLSGTKFSRLHKLMVSL